MLMDRAYEGESMRKTVHRLIQKPKLHTATEKDALEAKFINGLAMVTLTNEHGCHYVTVRRNLRKRGIEKRTRCTK